MTREEIEAIVEQYLSKQRGDSAKPKYGDAPKGIKLSETTVEPGLDLDIDDLFEEDEYGAMGKPKEFAYTDDMAKEFGGEGPESPLDEVGKEIAKFKHRKPDKALEAKKAVMAKLRSKVKPERIFRGDMERSPDDLLAGLFDEEVTEEDIPMSKKEEPKSKRWFTPREFRTKSMLF